MGETEVDVFISWLWYDALGICAQSVVVCSAAVLNKNQSNHFHQSQRTKTIITFTNQNSNLKHVRLTLIKRGKILGKTFYLYAF